MAKKTSNLKEKFFVFLANRYIIHFLIIILALGVSLANVSAYETRDDYGRNALIYKIVNLENYDEGGDTIATSDTTSVRSYVSSDTQLSSELFTTDQRAEEDIYREQYQNELAVIQGGSTLLKPELADTEAAKLTKKSIQEYVVEDDDTLGRIADKFDISINTVLWANNLTVRSFIRPGQKLIIPPVSGVLHKVAKGDTIIKIAQKYHADASRVTDFNDLKSTSGLTVGDILVIPDGQMIYTVKPQTTVVTTRNTSTRVSEQPVNSTGRMIWPAECRRITQYFRGWIHTGLDIACNLGSNIYAADTGVVVKAQYNRGGYGYYVIIQHDDGKQTLYGHLTKILVEPGQTIAQGQVIGLEGSTGRSTGPHLHFEVRVNGTRLNPLNYIR